MTPAETFRALHRVHASPLRDRPRPPAARFSCVVRAAPIVRDGSGWQLHPSGDTAPHGAWRWIVAVRDGCPVTPPGWDDDAHHMANAIAEPIVDLAALSVDFQRSLGTLCGISDVLGTPQITGWTDTLRLRRDPLVWLAEGMLGACLLRPAAEAAAYLRSFRQIVADDAKHGERIQAALRRDYQGPAIGVAAGAA